MKYITLIVLLFALFVFLGCGDNKEQNRGDQTLVEVDEIWQDNVPEDYMEDNSWGGKSYVLVPNSIGVNKLLVIDLYGYWLTEDTIECQEHYTGADISFKDTDKVVISLWKSINSEEDCPTVMPKLEKRHSYEVKGLWQIGDVIEVVVQNSDTNLSAFVYVE